MAKNVTVKDSYDLVLRSAARLFRRKGFRATTVREIARAAGILPGSLHYRYASKEEILVALMEQGMEQVAACVRARMASSNDAIERLRLALGEHVRLLLSNNDAVFVLLNEWRSLTGTARIKVIELRDRYEALWDEILADAVATGRFRAMVDIKLVRLLGFGAINWVAQWYKANGRYSPEEIADAFWNYLAFGILNNDPNMERQERSQL